MREVIKAIVLLELLVAEQNDDYEGWRAKYNLVFGPEDANVRNLLPTHKLKLEGYVDPDGTYQEDVEAYMGALADLKKKLQTLKRLEELEVMKAIFEAGDALVKALCEEGGGSSGALLMWEEACRNYNKFKGGRLMGTTRKEISDWFDDSKSKGATHMIVVCDTFDHEDYPVSVMPGVDVNEKFKEYNGKDMQRVMEVYAMHLDKEEQLNERIAMHTESAPAAGT